MAECLVHGSVPWQVIEHVVAADSGRAGAVTAFLTSSGHTTPVSVRPTWYF